MKLNLKIPIMFLIGFMTMTFASAVTVDNQTLAHENITSNTNIRFEQDTSMDLLEVDEDFVLDEEVRGIEIKIFSKLGEREDVQNINLRTRNEEFTKTTEILLPRDNEDYEYQVTYFLRGKDPRSSERKASNYGRIDIDRFLD